MNRHRSKAALSLQLWGSHTRSKIKLMPPQSLTTVTKGLPFLIVFILNISLFISKWLAETRPLSHSVTQSLSHSVTQPLSHSVTQSLSHSVTQPLSHSATQSLSLSYKPILHPALCRLLHHFSCGALNYNNCCYIRYLVQCDRDRHYQIFCLGRVGGFEADYAQLHSTRVSVN